MTAAGAVEEHRSGSPGPVSGGAPAEPGARGGVGGQFSLSAPIEPEIDVQRNSETRRVCLDRGRREWLATAPRARQRQELLGERLGTLIEVERCHCARRRGRRHAAPRADTRLASSSATRSTGSDQPPNWR
jgi:hypothetical protein